MWTDLTNFVLQLDPSKQDDLIRIENRPLDEGLCSRYSIDLLNINEKLNEMETQRVESALQMDTRTQGIESAVQEVLRYQRNEANRQFCKKKMIEQDTDEGKLSPYTLGQDVFYPHHLINLKSELNCIFLRSMLDVVMMDDGRLVIGLFFHGILLICNTDGSEEATVRLDGEYGKMTAVNSTVAICVKSQFSDARIELYDINNKHHLKSISLYGVADIFGSTIINDKLVVGIDKDLLIVDYQTGKIIQGIETNCQPFGITVSGSRIFFSEEFENNLYCYSCTDFNKHTLVFPSIPFSTTTLHDGSLYVLCEDRSVQHVSSDGEQFRPFKTTPSRFFDFPGWLRYNSKQKKMVQYSVQSGIVRILHEI